MPTAYVSNEGDDTNDGLTPETPKRSIVAALKLIRNNTGDWLYLRRGDRWDVADEGGSGKGVWRWDWHGVSESQRCGIGSYGDITKPRPVLENGGFWYGASVRPLKHFAIEGVEFYWSTLDPQSEKYQRVSADHRGFYVGVQSQAAEDSRDITVTDCVFRFCTVGAAINSAGEKIVGTRVYGNQFIECRNFGLMMERNTECEIEDNRFIECGWKDRTVQLHAVYTTDCDTISVRRNVFYLPGNFGLKFSGNAKSSATKFVIADNIFFGGGLGMGHARLDGSWNPLEEYSHEDGVVAGNLFSMTCKDFPPGSSQFQSIGCNLGNLRNVSFVDNLFIHNSPESGGEIFRFSDPTIERSSGISMTDNVVWNWASRQRRQQGTYITNLPADTYQDDNLTETHVYKDPQRSFERYSLIKGVSPRQLAENPDTSVVDIITWVSKGFDVIGETEPQPVPNPTPTPEPPKSETLQLVDAIKDLAAAIRGKG